MPTLVLEPRPAFAMPRAARGGFPYPFHRSLAQVDRDEARAAWLNQPPFLRRMMIDAGERPGDGR